MTEQWGPNDRLPTLTEAYQTGRDDERAALLDTGGYSAGHCVRCGWTEVPTTYKAVYEHQRSCPKSEVRLRTVPLERAILTDLIAELRAEHPRAAFAAGMAWCGRCIAPDADLTTGEVIYREWPCPSIEGLNRAEARLREVGGDE